MAGRQFDALNKALPEPVEQMLLNVPACFDQVSWRLYAIEAWRSVLNDPAERAAMSRGRRPDYCSSCTPQYQQRMQAAGRCFPPQLTPPPAIEAGSSVDPA